MQNASIDFLISGFVWLVSKQFQESKVVMDSQHIIMSKAQIHFIHSVIKNSRLVDTLRKCNELPFSVHIHYVSSP